MLFARTVNEVSFAGSKVEYGPMVTDMMDYNTMVQSALRGVVRKALDRAAVDGLPGQHHFYIGFRTGDPGVDIPDHLRASHPDEMTIVMQHQYWGLEIDDEGFAITLSFNHHNERLSVPYTAMTSFYDPSVQFGLQFPGPDAEATPGADLPDTQAHGAGKYRGDEAEIADPPASPAADDGDGNSMDNIVTLDTFRKD
jgi:hypothetical protein